MKQLIVRIPDELHKKLKLHAVEMEKDMAVLVTELLNEYFAKVEKKKSKKST
jgi:predicted HicB family RNase H-like nuclease